MSNRHESSHDGQDLDFDKLADISKASVSDTNDAADSSSGSEGPERVPSDLEGLQNADLGKALIALGRLLVEDRAAERPANSPEQQEPEQVSKPESETEVESELDPEPALESEESAEQSFEQTTDHVAEQDKQREKRREKQRERRREKKPDKQREKQKDKPREKQKEKQREKQRDKRGEKQSEKIREKKRDKKRDDPKPEQREKSRDKQQKVRPDKQPDEQWGKQLEEQQVKQQPEEQNGKKQEQKASWFGRIAFWKTSKQVPSWFYSALFHGVIILILAFWTIPVLTFQPKVLDMARFEETSLDEEIIDSAIDVSDFSETDLDLDSDVKLESLEVDQISPFDEQAAANASIESMDFGQNFASDSLLRDIANTSGSALDGRGAASRTSLVRRKGGNAASEKAVANSLEWLARHQLTSGAWSFDHTEGECNGQCGNPGNLKNAARGATALALLPFLGAGHTPEEGKHSETVYRGLRALVNMMQDTPNGGSFMDEGTMYSHGIASIALSEAYSMTDKKWLQRHAQAAIKFVCAAQDPSGGGWRYQPREPGDISVTGWQVLGLKSAQLAQLRVPTPVLTKASDFIDSLKIGEGHAYYYHPTDRAIRSSPPIGLLCKMHIDWKRDNPILKRGVEEIAAKGPSQNDPYYNYYATQVLFHYTNGEGDLWNRWNVVLRDSLVNSQAMAGHEKGSWMYSGRNVLGLPEGGRLYSTALSCMILEIYYRHLPIYGEIDY